jgi:hypothetical protein
MASDKEAAPVLKHCTRLVLSNEDDEEDMLHLQGLLILFVRSFDNIGYWSNNVRT